MYFYKISLNYLREYYGKKLKIRFKCKVLKAYVWHYPPFIYVPVMACDLEGRGS
jgi:hypothetical protein